MFIWILINILFLGVLISFTAINVLNLCTMPRLEQYPDPSDSPFVSIIFPARNEARNIARCTGSLLAQNYPAFEVIIVNDNSMDETGSILKELQDKYPGLKVLDGQPLPAGWTGKNWAAHQGFKASKGAILLFTDADTVHQPGTLKKAVAAFLQEKADFLTALPAQYTGSFSEKSVIPKIFWLAYSLFPFAYLDKIPSSASAFGIGQFMLYARTAYESSGGYAAIKNIICDDMMLASQIKKHGLRSLVVDGSAFIICRMYCNWREVYQGLTRTIYQFISHALPRWLAAPLYTLGITFLGLTFYIPLLTLVSCFVFFLAGFATPVMLWLPASLGIIFSCLSYYLVYQRFKFPLYMILLYPLNILAFQYIAYSSLLLVLLRKITWKGRCLKDLG
jgi:chlorobactene glucosyltransferase